MTPHDAERFWAKVERQDNGCWLWTAARLDNGYGIFGRTGGSRLVHRISYELAVGQIPDGLEIDHLCRVRNCVNPEHLEAVTHQENRRRGRGYGTNHLAGVTHCIHGHPFDEENTYVAPNGMRVCRTCQRAAVRAYRLRKKAG